MKKPHLLNAAYERSPIVQGNRNEFRRLREAFKDLDPAGYRGIARCALSESPEPDPGWVDVTQPNTSVDDDGEARRRLVEILGPDHLCRHYPCSVVQSLAHAKELRLLTGHPFQYEVVCLSRTDLSESPSLGFDVGYWSGGNYSILCDTVIWPMWHGPEPAAYVEPSQYVGCLNHHMLFPDPGSAERFRSFYRTQPWAETEAEPDDFCVIGVEVVD